MTENNHRGPPLRAQLRKTLSTGLGALQNRGELFLVELQEEKSRLASLLILGASAVFLGLLTLLLLTGIVIFLIPPEGRLWAAAGFALLYLLAASWAVFALKSMIKTAPFRETSAQLKKDRDLLESFR